MSCSAPLGSVVVLSRFYSQRLLAIQLHLTDLSTLTMVLVGNTFTHEYICFVYPLSVNVAERKV